MKLTNTNCPCVLTIYRKVLSKEKGYATSVNAYPLILCKKSDTFGLLYLFERTAVIQSVHSTVFPGGHRDMEPPDPIPNSEVKRVIADDSVGVPMRK